MFHIADSWSPVHPQSVGESVGGEEKIDEGTLENPYLEYKRKKNN